jgi:hypothetical protein
MLLGYEAGGLNMLPFDIRRPSRDAAQAFARVNLFVYIYAKSRRLVPLD